MSGFDHNIIAYSTSDLSKPHVKWSVNSDEVILTDRKSRSQKPEVCYPLSDSLNKTLPLQEAATESAQLAASAPLPSSDSETLDTSSSTYDQIDDVQKGTFDGRITPTEYEWYQHFARLSLGSTQSLVEGYLTDSPPGYTQRTPLALELTSPDTEVTLRDFSAVTVHETLLAFATYLLNQQHVQLGTTTSTEGAGRDTVETITTGPHTTDIAGTSTAAADLSTSVSTSNEQLEVVDDLTPESDSDEDITDSNFSPPHFNGTAVEDAEAWIRQFIKTCEACLVLSVTRILRATLAKFRVYVCMYVCM